MPFETILKELSLRTGATGAVLVDWEGELVASHSDRGLDMPLIGAHKGVILNAVKELSVQHEAQEGGEGDDGHVKSVSITTDKARLAVCALTEGLALVVVLERSGTPLARVLFECGRAVRLIEEEIG